MAEINLSKYGISGTTEIVHNPSYDLLFEEETWKVMRKVRSVNLAQLML